MLCQVRRGSPQIFSRTARRRFLRNRHLSQKRHAQQSPLHGIIDCGPMYPCDIQRDSCLAVAPKRHPQAM